MCSKQRHSFSGNILIDYIFIHYFSSRHMLSLTFSAQRTIFILIQPASPSLTWSPQLEDLHPNCSFAQPWDHCWGHIWLLTTLVSAEPRTNTVNLRAGPAVPGWALTISRPLSYRRPLPPSLVLCDELYLYLANLFLWLGDLLPVSLFLAGLFWRDWLYTMTTQLLI